jgi:hypothetical protein
MGPGEVVVLHPEGRIGPGSILAMSLPVCDALHRGRREPSLRQLRRQPLQKPYHGRGVPCATTRRKDGAPVHSSAMHRTLVIPALRTEPMDPRTMPARVVTRCRRSESYSVPQQPWSLLRSNDKICRSADFLTTG